MKSPLQVTGIDHVVFHVKDLARSKKFYIDFLGMDIDHESSWQCFLKCGNQGVALFEVEDGEEVHAGSEVNHMALRLVSGELARVKATLENAGHRSQRPPRRSHLHLLLRSGRPSSAATDAERLTDFFRLGQYSGFVAGGSGRGPGRHVCPLLPACHEPRPCSPRVNLTIRRILA